MALAITEECINCDLCAPQCPTAAISEGEEIYIIDAARCTECIAEGHQPKCVAVCPVDCIIPNPQHREDSESLWAKHRALLRLSECASGERYDNE